MSQSLSISNYNELNIVEKSYILASVSAGANTLTLANTQNFAVNDYVIIGMPGSETCELKTVSGVVAPTVTLSATLKDDHSINSPVTKLFGDQIKIYRAANVDGNQPDVTAFSPLITVSIDTDQQSTSYTDASGGDGYWYGFTYVNSTDSSETSLSDSKFVRGGGTGDYTTIDLIRRAASFERNTNIEESYIDTFRQAAQDTINGALSGRYVLPFKRPINAHIADLTRRIAGARLRLDQLPGNQDAKDMYTLAMSELNDLQQGNTTLTGETGTSDSSATSVNGGPGFGGYPNSKTEAAGGGGKRISITDRY